MFYGTSLQVECPTDSGVYMHLGHVAEVIQHRLQCLFVRGENGRRAVNHGNDMLDFDPHWKDYLWFYEFFDGDTGRGLGASHQCGWTGLIAKMIHDTGINCRLPHTPTTPSTAAAHYFDDIFFHSSKPSGLKPHIPHSSTIRSTGNRRSIYPSINGEDHAESADKSVDADGEERKREKPKRTSMLRITSPRNLILSVATTLQRHMRMNLKRSWTINDEHT